MTRTPKSRSQQESLATRVARNKSCSRQEFLTPRAVAEVKSKSVTGRMLMLRQIADSLLPGDVLVADSYDCYSGPSRSKTVFMLAVGPIVKKDRETKNECERNANRRLLARFRQLHPQSHHVPESTQAETLFVANSPKRSSMKSTPPTYGFKDIKLVLIGNCCDDASS
jgi:hypothetical protein